MPPDRWLEVTVRTSLEFGLVTSLLFDLGATGVEERGPDLVTHIPPPPDPDALLQELRSRLEVLDPGDDLDLSWRWQPQEAWEILWRKGLGPRRITPRITVTPSWEPVEQEEGHVLVLDPGMAFGTAEHATTRGCIRALDGLVEPGDRIADVGAGSGILAIAAVHLGAAHVMAVEMDAMSCETARENLVRNGAEGRVTVLEAEVQADGLLPEAPFDGIVANLQSHLLLPLLPAFTRSLLPDAWLVVSGILVEQAAEFGEAATDAGLRSIETDVEDGWWTATYRFRTRDD